MKNKILVSSRVAGYSVILLIISFITIGYIFPSITTYAQPEKDQVKTIIIPEILNKISWCESKDRQFNPDGTIFRGKINPKDVGKYQINEYYHLEDSMALGMDIYTLKGNTEYALYLYKKQGTTPWNWSKACWSK
jgi:hypothetical protein